MLSEVSVSAWQCRDFASKNSWKKSHLYDWDQIFTFHVLILGIVLSYKSSLINPVGCKQFLLYIYMHDLVNSILISVGTHSVLHGYQPCDHSRQNKSLEIRVYIKLRSVESLKGCVIHFCSKNTIFSNIVCISQQFCCQFVVMNVWLTLLLGQRRTGIYSKSRGSLVKTEVT